MATNDHPHDILKVLVGSQAHGLAGADSDADYRRVFAIPTERMFRLDFKPPTPRWTEGEADETAWEVGPFLGLAVRCHPLILETLLAPVVTQDEWGVELRALFPSLWSPRQAYESFVGYGHNQRQKFLAKKDQRPEKYAAAYVRVLYNLCELLDRGSFTVRIADLPIGATIARLKEGTLRTGEVIDLAERWTDEATARLSRCRHRPNLESVNEFMIRLRKAFLR
jgi:predicted nucleotidyltransferase